MCKKGTGWSRTLPDELTPSWESCVDDLNNLEKIGIPRCYALEIFGNILKTKLHHFSDASSQGYGQCCYVRLMGEDKAHGSLIMVKAGVASTKVSTILWLELTAADLCCCKHYAEGGVRAQFWGILLLDGLASSLGLCQQHRLMVSCIGSKLSPDNLGNNWPTTAALCWHKWEPCQSCHLRTWSIRAHQLKLAPRTQGPIGKRA